MITLHNYCGIHILSTSEFCHIICKTSLERFYVIAYFASQFYKTVSLKELSKPIDHLLRRTLDIAWCFTCCFIESLQQLCELGLIFPIFFFKEKSLSDTKA